MTIQSRRSKLIRITTITRTSRTVHSLYTYISSSIFYLRDICDTHAPPKGLEKLLSIADGFLKNPAKSF